MGSAEASSWVAAVFAATAADAVTAVVAGVAVAGEASVAVSAAEVQAAGAAAEVASAAEALAVGELGDGSDHTRPRRPALVTGVSSPPTMSFVGKIDQLVDEIWVLEA